MLKSIWRPEGAVLVADSPCITFVFGRYMTAEEASDAMDAHELIDGDAGIVPDEEYANHNVEVA